MKLATLFFLLIAAVVGVMANPPYYGKPSYSSYKEPEYVHPPYYKFDWAVKDDYYYNDYGQTESREGYNTKGNWWVKLPGYSHINSDYTVYSQPKSSYGGYEKPSYSSYSKPSYY